MNYLKTAQPEGGKGPILGPILYSGGPIRGMNVTSIIESLDGQGRALPALAGQLDQAHDLKTAGSNPAPATIEKNRI